MKEDVDARDKPARDDARTILPMLTVPTRSHSVQTARQSTPEELMDGLAVADLKNIVAPLNFLVPMMEKPVAYNYEPPPGVPVRTGESEEHRVTIRDARLLIGQLSLDTEGFVLLRHESAVENFYDEDEINRVYYPECERVIREATGASRIVAFDHIVR